MNVFWTRLNWLAAACSILALPGAFLTGYWKLGLLSILAIAVVALAISSFKISRKSRIIHGKESLIRKGIEIISSAQTNVTMFASDMSWAPNYLESLRSAVQRGVEVLVIFDDAGTRGRGPNRSMLENIGALTYEIPFDFKFRGTLVDKDSDETAILFVARKKRANVAADVHGTHAPPDSQFLYECQVYGYDSNPGIIGMGRALYATLMELRKNKP